MVKLIEDKALVAQVTDLMVICDEAVDCLLGVRLHMVRTASNTSFSCKNYILFLIFSQLIFNSHGLQKYCEILTRYITRGRHFGARARVEKKLTRGPENVK
jgi:hypothetical protein